MLSRRRSHEGRCSFSATPRATPLPLSLPGVTAPSHGAAAQSALHAAWGGVPGSHLASPQGPPGWRMVAFQGDGGTRGRGAEWRL